MRNLLVSVELAFCVSLPLPPASPASASVLTRAAAGFRVTSALVPVRACVYAHAFVCCRVLWNSSGKESPHWPAFSKHAMTVSRGDPTEHQFSWLQLDPSSSHRAFSQSVLSVPGRKGAHHLKRALPMYLSKLHRMWAFVTTSLSSQTRRAMSSLPVEEHTGRSSIWGIKFQGVCNGHCSNLWKHLSNWGSSDCKVSLLPFHWKRNATAANVKPRPAAG